MVFIEIEKMHEEVEQKVMELDRGKVEKGPDDSLEN